VRAVSVSVSLNVSVCACVCVSDGRSVGESVCVSSSAGEKLLEN